MTEYKTLQSNYLCSIDISFYLRNILTGKLPIVKCTFPFVCDKLFEKEIDLSDKVSSLKAVTLSIFFISKFYVLVLCQCYYFFMSWNIY